MISHLPCLFNSGETVFCPTRGRLPCRDAPQASCWKSLVEDSSTQSNWSTKFSVARTFLARPVGVVKATLRSNQEAAKIYWTKDRRLKPVISLMEIHSPLLHHQTHAIEVSKASLCQSFLCYHSLFRFSFR